MSSKNKLEADLMATGVDPERTVLPTIKADGRGSI